MKIMKKSDVETVVEVVVAVGTIVLAILRGEKK